MKTKSKHQRVQNMNDIMEKAKKWSLMDPNPLTSNYALQLIEKCKSENEPIKQKAEMELESLFNKRIDFGTAGLRAKMFVGPTCMNDLIIIQTTQGLARYCQSIANKKSLTAVIGYDHRSNSEFQLSSYRFALYTRLIFEKAGFSKVVLLSNDPGTKDDVSKSLFVATPLVSFATIELKAACGVMITASHNPKDDNGFKVYWNDGCQIRPPLDKGIKNSILLEENLTPWENYKIEETSDKGDVEETNRLINLYFQKMKDTGLMTGIGKNAVLYAKEQDISIPKIAYTAMHGVGHFWAKRSFEEFELPPFFSVPTQQNPDSTFSTVTFPNPEEKGALNLAIEFSKQNNLNIILANDPDADRLAVAERIDDIHIDKEWHTFTGDQIGVMLGHWIYEQIGKKSKQPIAMCASTVSSSMLSKIAKMEDFHFEDTLTGFKWIGTRVLSLRNEKAMNDATNSNYRVIFAYEEAIGFCCGEVIPDKDGVSAISVFAELAYYVYIHKRMTLLEHMQSLYDKYGEFVSHNGYYFYNDPSIPNQIFNHIRNGGKYHSSIDQYKISSIRDLGSPGYDSSTPDNKPVLPVSSSSPMMTIKFENGCVAQFRASGTEPKFKYYIEMAGTIGNSREIVEKELEVMADIILNALIRPKELGIKG